LAGEELPPPPLQRGQRVGWADLSRFAQALLGLLRDRRDRVERRLRKCLALANLCRQARFEAVTGKRPGGVLDGLGGGPGAEGAVARGAVAPPSWVGRLLFRLLLAVYARKDRGLDRRLVGRTRLGLLWAAWRFARGRGKVPRLHARLPETTFEQ